MPATYNPDLTAPKDQVRFLIGDKAAPFKFQDEEINFLLVQDSDTYSVAIKLVTSLIATASAAGATKSIGPFSISGATNVSALRELLDSLVAEQVRNRGISPYSGGLHVSDRAEKENDSITHGSFARGMTDDRSAGENWEAQLRGYR